MNSVLRILKLNVTPALIVVLLFLTACADLREHTNWPVYTYESKPWTRWWWQGSAVTKEGISHELEMMRVAGIGGVEITPVYGVYGTESEFVPFLSEQWVELLLHTLSEAQRLGLGVDMATGTGWPFGGPWVSSEDACKNLQIATYDVVNESTVPRKIEYIQQPYLRRVGFNIPNVKKSDPEIKQPIESNTNLQELAIDQVQFETSLPLIALMAFQEGKPAINITDKVSKDGELKWNYPGGSWKLYALFQGWHGKLVERAGPGGEGNVIDHFSKDALRKYLAPFDNAFAGKDIERLRAFFNDSYEVDDARGTADWTPRLLEEFKARRGYDLLEYLPQLHHDTTEVGRRVLCDYRETVSELLLDNFTKPWRDWAKQNHALVRNQAHGSPSNILDLYGTVDIPEIEGSEPLRIKMASSAGNVMKKRLVAAEAATWLDEHFESNLGEVKEALDRFMLHGVNHLVYHGTAYSPKDAQWPGWLFYAAVHFNSRNPEWRNFGALNQYVSRCQSFLQSSFADNDVLLYYPVYDRFSTPGPERLEHFDGIGRQFEGTSFERCAEDLLSKGFSFDYISDAQIKQLTFKDKELTTRALTKYKAIIVPQCSYIPVNTLHALLDLAEDGALVIFYEGFPEHSSGFANNSKNEKWFDAMIREFGKYSKKDSGLGKVRVGNDLLKLFEKSTVRREELVEKNIQYIRKRDEIGNVIYFLKNAGDATFSGWLSLNTPADGFQIDVFNPQTSLFGKGKLRKSEKGNVETFLQLQPGETIILRLSDPNRYVTSNNYSFYSESDQVLKLEKPWNVEFISGGPELPPATTLDSLIDWTKLGDRYAAFSGSATYTTTFALPKNGVAAWKLSLGEVRESAAVYVNEIHFGTVIGPTYDVVIPPEFLKHQNTLKIVVSNSMANRIIDMERKGVPWKKFYNINFPSRKPENRVDGLFSAAHWEPKPSGLLGPVKLIALNVLPVPAPAAQ